MVALTKRVEKGNTLLKAEVDNNFDNLNTQKIDAIGPASSGTNTITATYSPTVTAYMSGVIYVVNITTTTTAAAVTLNLDGAGAKNVVGNDPDKSQLAAGSLRAGVNHYFLYDGSQFICLNPWTHGTLRPAAVTDHITTTKIFVNDSRAQTFGVLETVVTEGTYESFGSVSPASGATNTQVSMNDMPPEAGAMRCIASVECTPTSNVMDVEIYFRPGDVSWAATNHFFSSLHMYWDGVDSGQQCQWRCHLESPIDPSDGTVDITWRCDSESARDINVFFTGFCM